MYFAVVWLTGRRGSGKSSVGRMIRELDERVVVLDQDELSLYWNSEEDRMEEYEAIARIASSILSQGHPVVVAAKAPTREQRDHIKELCPVVFILTRRDDSYDCGKYVEPKDHVAILDNTRNALPENAMKVLSIFYALKRR